MITDAEGIATSIISALAEAWNRADGEGFGELFTADADFVDIRGVHHQGRDAIAAGHQSIFDSIYQGSQLDYKLVKAKRLSENLILVHTSGDLTVPSGPLAGRGRALQSLILVQEGNGWKIMSFQNTAVAQQH